MRHLAGDPFRLPDGGWCPWTTADQAFAGWVPNVSGHLSFNLIDPGSKHPTFNNQDRLDRPRQVAVHRMRLAQDYPFPDWAVKLFRPSARQDFIMLAETGRVRTPYFREGEFAEADDGNGVLVGVVAVLPSDSDRRTRRLVEETLAAVEQTVTDAVTEKATGGVDPSRRITREALDLLEDARDRIACYLLRFALYRTGELRIWFDLGEFLGRDVAADAASHQEFTAARHLAPQAYYFVKDLLHAHYHHTANSDQLLPLVETPRPTDDVQHDANEVAWRYAPLRGLARVVVELRHGRSPSGHQQAKGIIAYAQSYQSVLAHVVRPRRMEDSNRPSDGIIPYDFANLAMSLDATDASTQAKVSAQLQLFGIVIGIFLSGLALWAGAVQIQQPLCEALGPDVCPKVEPGPVVSLVNWVVANPSAFLGILLTAGVFAFVFFFRGLNALPWLDRGVRWLRRLAEATGVQVSRWMRDSDLLGYAVSLLLLGALTAVPAAVAVWLAPSKEVPAVSTRAGSSGPWSSLDRMVGRRADRSGILVTSVIAQQLRMLLGDDYGAFLRSFTPNSTLNREGDLLVLASASTVGGDGAYLVVDPRFMRLEAGVRREGELKVHRTQGVSIRRPPSVIQFLGAAGRTDGAPIPTETSTCDIAPGGKSGRTLHLSGYLRARDFCEYNIELQKGQALGFDRMRANGLDVLLVDGGTIGSIGTGFVASRGGRHLVRVVWAGWHPRPADALRPRQFYVRLAIH